MLNHKLGSSREIDGHSWMQTKRGHAGFALYGPYVMLQPGHYAVEFRLQPVEFARVPSGDPRCVALDVAGQGGAEQVAKRWIHASQLTQGRTRFVLPFELETAGRVEFRAWVNGELPLVIADLPRCFPMAAIDDPEAEAAATRFPEEEADAVPFFHEQRALLQRLHAEGARVGIREGRVVVGVAGVSLFCDSADDLNFVGEVFHEGTYNFKSADPVCAIDIGMNIGLSSLQFAGKPEVTRVHSFEPFRNTYERALDNLRLNPQLAAKISAHNVGLTDRDLKDTLRLIVTHDSGSGSVIEHPTGVPVQVVLRDAGALLAPIVSAARAAGERVIAKVDCEGSEFAVFESLRRHELLGKIDAFMVEWHAMFADRDQDTLIGPLRDAGFLVFDRSPPNSNGFFYAVRLG